MNRCRNLVATVTMAILMIAVAAVAWGENSPQVKGIILLIGDGMGLNQVRSADIYSRQVLGKSLALDSIVTRGITTTYSANSEVTDSAAAATALYSGHKNNNGVINILPDGKYVNTIGEAAKKSGMSVGVISTARLTDATPAAVYSHAPRRNMEGLIAEQLSVFSPEVAMAGGLQYFIPKGSNGSKRKDDKNLIKVMESKGYTYVKNASELRAVDPKKTDKLFGLFAKSHMAYELDRQNVPGLGNQPSLADMTDVAVKILGTNPKGFFVMIEGGRIDHACHAHDIKASIYDVLAFDDAVKVALDYQKTHHDVLVLVTADHETGGLGLGRGIEYALDLAALQPIKNSLEYLSKQIKKNPAKFEEIITAAGFDLTAKEKALLSAYPPGSSPDAIVELSGYHDKIKKYVFSQIHYALSSIESDRAKIGWTSFAHTAQPVITYAVGPGEKEFSGFYDNTDIAKKMAKLLRVNPGQPYLKPGDPQ
jgi:alkaline phosphatase